MASRCGRPGFEGYFFARLSGRDKGYGDKTALRLSLCWYCLFFIAGGGV